MNKRISKKKSKRNVKRRSKLIMKGGKDKMNITVRAIDDNRAIFTTTVNPYDSIKTLKEEILAWFDVSLENQEIIYDGIIITEDRIMGQIPIKNDSTVYIRDISRRPR